MAELAAEPGHTGLPSREQAEVHYDEAVAVAVAACAADTAGQRCYICFGEGDEDEGLVRMCACRGDNGFAHVSCLARGAQAAVERDADTGWARWYKCGLCEQDYHGVVRCALGWACWKTYVGRPEPTDRLRSSAMRLLGNGLSDADRHEDALSVYEAVLSTLRRIGGSERAILAVQTNLAASYGALGRLEEASSMQRDVHSGRLKLNGDEDGSTLRAANNYACGLLRARRFEEARSVLRKTMPVTRRVLGEGDQVTLKMRWVYAMALCRDPNATLDDMREAVNALEESARIARRVLGGAHPITRGMEETLRRARAARAALRGREDRDDESLYDTDVIGE